MAASIPRRLRGIKHLVREYLKLKKGDLIEKHTELLRVCDVRGSENKKHPHKNKRIYISRKALKHCVESRTEEIGKHHTALKVEESICFAIDRIPEIIVNFDHYEYEPKEGKHFYSKNYYHLQKSKVRILVEENNGCLEIISIHFRK